VNEVLTKLFESEGEEELSADFSDEADGERGKHALMDNLSDDYKQETGMYTLLSCDYSFFKQDKAIEANNANEAASD
jgi:hypothetical protein